MTPSLKGNHVLYAMVPSHKPCNGEEIKMKSNILLLLIAAAIIFSIYSQQNDNKQDQAEDNIVSMAVTTVQPKIMTLKEIIYASGATSAKEEVIVTTELNQVRIKAIFKEEGDYVESDAPLAMLDTESLKNQFDQLDAQYKEAKKSFMRSDAIKKSGAISPDQLDQKRAAFALTQAQRNDALLKIHQAEIKSPAAGLIYERHARIGALASNNNNEPLFRIAQDGIIEFEAYVSEVNLKYFSIAQPVNIHIAGFNDMITGSSRLISPRIEANHTAKVRITLQTQANIPLGAFGNISIIANEKEGLTLPASAVIQEKNQTIVWLVNEDKKVTKIPVIIELRAEGRVIIQSPALTVKSTIVAKAGVFLKEGDTISYIPGNLPTDELIESTEDETVADTGPAL